MNQLHLIYGQLVSQYDDSAGPRWHTGYAVAMEVMRAAWVTGFYGTFQQFQVKQKHEFGVSSKFGVSLVMIAAAELINETPTLLLKLCWGPTFRQFQHFQQLQTTPQLPQTVPARTVDDGNRCGRPHRSNDLEGRFELTSTRLGQGFQ